MFKLQNGDDAPEITLTSVTGEEWNLSQRRGKMVVLHFVRGEFCPTPRGEIAYWDSFAHIFEKMNCEIVFLANGGREEYKKYAENLHLRAPILIDEDGAIGTEYNVYGVNTPVNDDCKTYLAPSVYLIDAEGKISCFWILSGPRGRPSPECLLGILCYAQDNDWKY
jgi:peroxiredoxin Q/BCP